jgi:hypothetical protein
MIKDIGQFGLVRGIDQIGGRGAVLAHPHVERAVLLEGKPALGPGQAASRTRPDPARRHPAARRPAVSRSEKVPSASDRNRAILVSPAGAICMRQRIAVDADHPVRTGRQQAAGIAPCPEGAVEPDARNRRHGGQERRQQERGCGGLAAVGGSARTWHHPPRLPCAAHQGQRVDILVVVVLGQFGLVDFAAVQLEAVGAPAKTASPPEARSSPRKPIFSRTFCGRTMRPSGSISIITERLIRSRSARSRVGRAQLHRLDPGGQPHRRRPWNSIRRNSATCRHRPCRRGGGRLRGDLGSSASRMRRKAAGIETRAFPSTFW